MSKICQKYVKKMSKNCLGIHGNARSTVISPELMQVFANGKRRVHSFIEFYVKHLKNQEVKI